MSSCTGDTLKTPHTHNTGTDTHSHTYTELLETLSAKRNKSKYTLFSINNEYIH